MTGAQMHNLYPVLYHRSSHEFAAPPGAPIARLHPVGLHGVHPYAQLVWGGDPTTGFGFDGLELGGAAGADDGALGHLALGLGHRRLLRARQNELTPELSSAGSRSARSRGSCARRPTGWRCRRATAPADRRPRRPAAWRRYAKLRTQLYPYLSAARRRVPAHRPAAHAAPRAWSPRRRTAPLPRRRVHVRPGPAGGAGGARRPSAGDGSTCRAGAGWTCGAGSPITAGGGLVARPRSIADRWAQSVDLPAPIEEVPLLARGGSHPTARRRGHRVRLREGAAAGRCAGRPPRELRAAGLPSRALARAGGQRGGRLKSV